MLQRSLILCMLLSSFLGCARFHMHPKTSNIPGSTPINQDTYTIPFHRVKITGPFDVNLHTHSARSRVTFHAKQKDLKSVKWYVAKNQLVIWVERENAKTHIGHIYIDIDVPHLSAFSYQGKGSVVAQSFRTKSLDLLIQNDGQTRLEGNFSIHQAAFGGQGSTRIKGVSGRDVKLILSGDSKVQMSGNIELSELKIKNHARLSAYWIKSHNLKIKIRDQACVQLAGQVDFLDAVLRDEARLNGRYLRAKRAFVKTDQKAEADIDVIDAQHTLASGASNIYFYDLPDMKVDFMAENGSVLDLREWERPFFQ